MARHIIEINPYRLVAVFGIPVAVYKLRYHKGGIIKKLLLFILMAIAASTSYADTTIVQCIDTCNAPAIQGVIATVTVSASRDYPDSGMLINYLSTVGGVRGVVEVRSDGAVSGAFISGGRVYQATSRSVTITVNGVVTHRYNRPRTSPGYNVP